MKPIPCAGKIVEVDLSKRRSHILEMPETVRNSYLGGVGYAAKVLWDETDGKTAALSPENVLIFTTGPLTGLNIPASSRYTVASISPLTGIWGEAHAGGDWADELRHAGFEGVIVRGRADRPVYLWINNGKVEIRDADHVWGLDTYQTHDLLQKETEGKASIACIGRAGERQVKIAGIMNDGKKGRAAARCGLGAVMGYKNLKAIAARGTMPIRVADEERLKQIVKEIYQKAPVEKGEQAVHRQVKAQKTFFRVGGAPIKNWLEGTWEPGDRLVDDLLKASPLFCRHCPYLHAGSKLTIEGERYMVWEHLGPVGSQCLIDDPAALQLAYSLCNRYGIDCISVGGVISMAMECYEKGLLTKEDTDGLDLSWGNAQVLPTLVEMIGEARGFGALLGQGVATMAENIGPRASEYAIHTKRLEFPAHDPRAASGIALAYATSSLGASHVETVGLPFLEGYLEGEVKEGVAELGYPLKMSRFTEDGKAPLVAICQDLGCLMDSLQLCRSRYMQMMGQNKVYPSYWWNLLNAATGWHMTYKEAMDIGERIFNLKRMFNVRRGVSRKDDNLPPRILCHKRGTGGAPDYLPHLGSMLNEYYSYRGWGEEGIPSLEKLRELNLDDCLPLSVA